MLHAKMSKNKIIIEYILVTIPLLMMGLYKNGYLLYARNLITLASIFKIFIYFLISIGSYFIINFIFKRKIVFDYDFLYFYLLPFFLMPNTNIIIYSVVVVISLFMHLVLRKIKYNRLALMKLLISLGMFIFSTYEYKNLLEIKYNFSYNFWDLIIGYQVGGYLTNSILIGLLILIFLKYRGNIKALIPTISYTTYFLLSLIIMLITKDFNYHILINCNVVLPLIIVATDNENSPITKIGIIIYSIFIGLATVLFSNIINYYEGVFIAILIASIIYGIFNYGYEFDKFKKFYRKNKGKRV